MHTGKLIRLRENSHEKKCKKDQKVKKSIRARKSVKERPASSASKRQKSSRRTTKTDQTIVPMDKEEEAKCNDMKNNKNTHNEAKHEASLDKHRSDSASKKLQKKDNFEESKDSFCMPCEVLFKTPDESYQGEMVSLINGNKENEIIFKFKSNAKNFVVKPVCGYVSPGDATAVKVTCRPLTIEATRSSPRHRLSIMIAPKTDNMPEDDPGKCWDKQKPWSPKTINLIVVPICYTTPDGFIRKGGISLSERFNVEAKYACVGGLSEVKLLHEQAMAAYKYEAESNGVDKKEPSKEPPKEHAKENQHETKPEPTDFIIVGGRKFKIIKADDKVSGNPQNNAAANSPGGSPGNQPGKPGENNATNKPNGHELLMQMIAKRQREQQAAAAKNTAIPIAIMLAKMKERQEAGKNL